MRGKEREAQGEGKFTDGFGGFCHSPLAPRLSPPRKG